MRPAHLAWLAGASLAATATWASAADRPEALRRCAAIEEDAQRLACYDRYMAGEEERPAEPATARSGGPEPEKATEPARDAEAGSGLPGRGDAGREAAAGPARDAEAGFGLPEREDAETEIREISATVVRIVQRANRERIFTLDNGQVWVEDSPTRSVRVKEGDTVRIRAGLFGSYRLSVGSSHRSTGVDRVR